MNPPQPRNPDPTDPKPVDRRAFFRAFLLRGINRVEGVVKPVTDAVARVSARAQGQVVPGGPAAKPQAVTGGQGASGPARFLRPPGALPEKAFAETCSACGRCADACPAHCIVIEPGVAGGLPHIIARESPCVICDDLACMNVCPTGALKLVESRTLIRMGVAEVDHDRCLRGGDHGEDCRLCVTQCPIGDTALGIDDAGRVEVRPGCTGCGVCEKACPTEPASVVVKNV